MIVAQYPIHFSSNLVVIGEGEKYIFYTLRGRILCFKILAYSAYIHRIRIFLLIFDFSFESSKFITKIQKFYTFCITALEFYWSRGKKRKLHFLQRNFADHININNICFLFAKKTPKTIEYIYLNFQIEITLWCSE